MPLTVHHLQVSQSERVPWLCEELGIDYDLKNYKRSPIFSPPDYKALHPIGAAPVIQDGDITIAESGACMEYIANIYGRGKLTIKPGDPAYADYLYWWHWANGTFQPLIGRMMSQVSAGISSDNMLVKHAQQRFANNLKLLEDRVASNEWLAGKEFSLADIMLLFSLTTMRYFMPYSLQDYPNVLKYIGRASQRAAYRTAMKKCDPDMELVLGADAPESFIDRMKREQGKM